MRITKQGRKRPNYPMKWHCPKCDTRWELDENDPPPAGWSDRGEYGVRMACPTCKFDVYVQTSPKLTSASIMDR